MKVELFIYKQLGVQIYFNKEDVHEGRLIVNNFYLFFPGLPQILKDNFFSDKIAQKTAIAVVHYYGSWFSGGEFLPDNCSKTIIDAINFIYQKRGAKTFDNKELKWDFDFLNLIGYSFGALNVARSNPNYYKVNSVFLFSPMLYVNKKDIGKYLSRDKSIDHIGFNKFFMKFLQRGYFNNYRGITNNKWNDFFNGNYTEKTRKQTNNELNYYIFHGDQDTTIPVESSKYFCRINKKAKLFILKGLDHDTKEKINLKSLNSIGAKNIDSKIYKDGLFEERLITLCDEAGAIREKNNFKKNKEGFVSKQEVVFFDINRSEIIKKIKATDIRFVESFREHIYTFDFATKDLYARHSYIRIKNINDKTWIQYKRVSKDNNLKYRNDQEIVFSVNNTEIAKSILRKMYLLPTGYQERDIDIFKKDKCNIKIISWPRTNPYLGIEFAQAVELKKIMNLLSLNEECKENKNGMEIFKKYKLPLKNLKFE